MKAIDQLHALVSKEFLSKLSHHTRSPFNGLLGFSELLLLNQKKLSDADEVEYLLRVNMLAKKAFISTENMILWLKLVSDNVQVISAPIAFAGVEEHAYNLSKEGIQLKKIHYESTIEPKFALTGDSFLMNCLFTNLISKAVKLGSEGSEIILSGEIVKGKQVVSINYTGMDIESEIVMDFFAGKGESALFAPELDIELWICYQLAVLQNLRFSIMFSKIDGTTFVIEEV
jgi:two-component system sensor histidine kinase/response regulator